MKTKTMKKTVEQEIQELKAKRADLDELRLAYWTQCNFEYPDQEQKNRYATTCYQINCIDRKIRKIRFKALTRGGSR